MTSALATAANGTVWLFVPPMVTIKIDPALVSSATTNNWKFNNITCLKKIDSSFFWNHELLKWLK
jgi:hypothetical protein